MVLRTNYGQPNDTWRGCLIVFPGVWLGSVQVDWTEKRIFLQNTLCERRRADTRHL